VLSPATLPAIALSRADIANTATRIFLQEFGGAYDDARGLPRWVKAKHFQEVVDFFGDKCCWLAVERRVPEL
jgi:hypothetical protein